MHFSVLALGRPRKKSRLLELHLFIQPSTTRQRQRQTNQSMSRKLVPTPLKAGPTHTGAYPPANGAFFPRFGGFQPPVMELIGTGHIGVQPMDRILMSLKSGIESEVEYALNTLTYISCTEPGLINFDRNEFLGRELIHHFLKPYQLILDEKSSGKLTSKQLTLSLEALITLRNAVQDIDNQQWLSQVKYLKKHLVEILKLFVGWFYTNTLSQNYHIASFNNLWKESFIYLLDLLDPLTCYYVDNNKQDPLFNQLLHISSNIKDKYVFITSLKCLGHLLFLSGTAKTNDDVSGDSEIKTAPHNCIDNIKEEHLETYISMLYINDDELTYAILTFLKQYLFSEALHPSFPNSIKDSQLLRLKKVVQISSSRLNLHTLMKQLPLLIVSNLSLLDSEKVSNVPRVNLSKRSAYSGVPKSLPALPKELHDIIIRFPEPLRATTWLRCCYEPTKASYKATDESSSPNEVSPGEVTQISLWKAYESQFEAVWKNNGTPPPEADWPSLLPAVDFIKNVNSAFPESEAMVVNLPSKKKFVIKGIQPRQFAVPIDVGNYEALKKSDNGNDSEENEELPVGHIDSEKFDESLTRINSEILSTTNNLRKFDHYVINFLSYDILDYIISELLDSDTDGEYKNIFRHYNKDWLPQLIFANPGLVENSYVNSKWLLYLL